LSEVITEVSGNDQTAAGRGGECHQSRARIDAIAGRVLSNAVEIDRVYQIGCDDWFQETAARQGGAHRALELEDGRAGIADADLLVDDLTVSRVLKEEGAERAPAQHKEPQQRSQLVETGCWIVLDNTGPGNGRLAG
jgi:hypothetical protein